MARLMFCMRAGDNAETFDTGGLYDLLDQMMDSPHGKYIQLTGSETTEDLFVAAKTWIEDNPRWLEMHVMHSPTSAARGTDVTARSLARGALKHPWF